MFQIDPFSFIPQSVKQEALNLLINVVSDQAKRLVGSELAAKIQRLRSDGGFNQKFEAGLKRAVQRFHDEYEAQDEDLTSALVAEKNLFQSQEVQAALLKMLKQPGAYLAAEHATLEEAFADVLPARKNRERVNRAITYLLKCLAEELWHLPEFMPVYSLQFQRLTAEAVHQQVALQKAQLQALTTLDAGLRDALLQLTDAIAERKLLPAPAEVPSLPPKPKVYHNLPQPDYTRFVGRERELAWLRRRLLPKDRAWQIAINGIGGVGKSALALALAHEYLNDYDQLPPEEHFDAIIWISAKEEVLTARGKEQAALPEQVMRTLEDVYTAIARALEREDITRALPEEQNQVVERALKAQRTLLIMDNLESVKDERIKPLLRNLPDPTKAIITSREWLDVADVLQLKGLPEDEADKLIAEEAAVRQVKINEAQRKRLYELTSGLPLPIRLGVARLAGGESFEAVTRWLGNAAGDLPKYCIKGQAELARERDPNAWCLLLACSLFDRGAGASREALGYVADLSLADRDAGLAQLQRLFLVNRKENDRFWVLPIVQRYVEAQLAESELRKNLIQRWLAWLENFAQNKGLCLDLEVEQIQNVGMEYPNLLSATRWCKDQNRWETLFRLAEGIWTYAYLVGLFHELTEILSLAAEAAKVLGDEQKTGRVELMLGRLAVIHGESEDIVNGHLSQSEEIAARYNQVVDLVETWATQTRLLINQQRLDDAEQIVCKMLETGNLTGNLQIKVSGACRFSEVEAWRKNFSRAFEWLDKAEVWAKELKATRYINTVVALRGQVLLWQKDYFAAETYITKALEMSTFWQGHRYIAIDKANLARVYAKTDRLQLARQFAREAYDLFSRLGLVAELRNVQELLQQLPPAEDGE